MRIRSSKTLVFQADGEKLIACNFLTKAAFECSYDLLDFLRNLPSWASLRSMRHLVPGYSARELRETIDGLVEMSVVVTEGSLLDKREREFLLHWKWGIPAALMHFCVQDPEFLTLEQAEDLQRAQIAEVGRMQLCTLNTEFREVQTLPNNHDSNAVLQLMEKRRTVRQGSPHPIDLDQLSDCLFAGLGITGETQNCVGSLPLSMTPSGGARNPYEAYVFAKNVDGLAQGIYHYSALEHSLGKMTDEVPVLSSVVGGQEWADTMPCLIVLCAQMDRTMWKYADANAYRVVMIEAGHIGQNIMLMATSHGLTACPTAALNHSPIAQLLQIENPTHAPVYALTLGAPSTSLGHSPRLRISGQGPAKTKEALPVGTSS